jgi:hypothetical protein
LRSVIVASLWACAPLGWGCSRRISLPRSCNAYPTAPFLLGGCGGNSLILGGQAADTRAVLPASMAWLAHMLTRSAYGLATIPGLWSKVDNLSLGLSELSWGFFSNEIVCPLTFQEIFFLDNLACCGLIYHFLGIFPTNISCSMSSPDILWQFFPTTLRVHTLFQRLISAQLPLFLFSVAELYAG